MNISTMPTPDNPPEMAPTDEQSLFLAAVDAALDGEQSRDLRLRGGPGTGKSWTIARAAERAAARGWVVFLVGPTHQATGVLAAAVPMAYPFEPDPKAALEAGDIMYCTAHRLCAWVQRSRSRGAAAGEVDPVPRDSWLGRSFRPSWDNPPEGVLVIADETSMYPDQMVYALRTTLATLRRECGRAAFVSVGDPNQLTPVRGRAYEYFPGEGPETPSLLVSESSFDDHALTVNVRAKSSFLKKVVQTYLDHKQVPKPPEGQSIYQWAEANDEFFAQWAERVEAGEPGEHILLGYRRATVATANEKLSQMLLGVSAGDLIPDQIMRVQETYSPRTSTLAASSDLVQVLAVEEEKDDVLQLILPPQRGHGAAHDARVIEILREIVSDELKTGPMPVVSVEVMGVRAGILTKVPVHVTTESEGGTTATAARWLSLEGRISHAAFRKGHRDPTIRRGLAAVYYYLADNAKLRLEAPYAMTSHRAQGSTYPHVGVLADGSVGGRVVDHRIASARDASAYVMLSRASKSLTIAWHPAYAVVGGSFSF